MSTDPELGLLGSRYYEAKLGTAIDDWMYRAVKQIDPNVKNAVNGSSFVCFFLS